MEVDLGPVAMRGYQARLRGGILCTPALGAHPQASTVQALHQAWALEVGLWKPSNLHTLAELEFCWLWADCLAHEAPEVAALMPDYCAMFTILDDTAERFIGNAGEGGLAELRAAFQSFYEVLAGTRLEHVRALDYPKYEVMCRALASLRDRIVPRSSPAQYARFLAGMRSYFDGVLQQVYFASRNVALSRETQIYNRERNVAFAPTVALVAIMLGVDLPEEVTTHPLFERVQVAICRLGGIVNDIISFPKETRDSDALGQYHNLIAAELNDLVAHGESDPLQRAIDRAFALHNREMADFLELGALLSSDHPEHEAYHQLCGDVHRSWMSWCLKVTRYSWAFAEPARVFEAPLAMAWPAMSSAPVVS